MENANTFWADKPIYADAECKYYEQLAKEVPLTPLADKVAKARQRLIEIKDTYNKDPNATASEEAVKCLEAKVSDLLNIVSSLQSTIGLLEKRVCQLENKCTIAPVNLKTIESTKKPVVDDDDDDDVDLFGSESEDDEKAAKVKEERVAAYNAKKSKKPALIAKSNVILDIKPWDDETDMKAMELEIRKIVADGLLLGAAKLVPLAYGIFKLQMSCVIEDEKISVDWLQENIESIEDYVQSCDVAAFNKI